jgi:hypothetical protein
VQVLEAEADKEHHQEVEQKAVNVLELKVLDVLLK